MNKITAEQNTRVEKMYCCGGMTTHKKNCEKLKRDCFTNSDERHNPRNRMSAYCFQFHDDIQVMFSTAHVSKESFDSALATLESHINAYKGI